ncbi:A24 family peptidase [Paraburkholderia lycopersici]|uniref:Prepilin peptidase CpaA n=1 Tax=Paraburkholderia lycopersici TaxID=416944 RepID=A0A1G6VZN0_9BURK|nr:prepilin peptidase [Paraburkholderia lycopersici]SDD59018.1 prepilin peptidase CpaA [Paraburkholderia lycopersici]
MSLLSLVVRLAAMGTLGWLAVTDVRDRRLPNKGVLAVAILFFTDAALAHMSLSETGGHVLVAAVAAVLCVGLYLMNMLGGGDVKLIAALALWVGTNLLVATSTLMLVAVTGLFIALLGLATRRLDPAACFGPMRGLAFFSCRRGVPYGVALAAGGSAAILLPLWLPGAIAHFVMH